jgi:hypothetical protein
MTETNQENDKHCSIHNYDYSGDECLVCLLIKLAGSWNTIWQRHTKEPHQQELLVRAAFTSYECGKVLKLAKKCDRNNRAIAHLYNGYVGDLHGDFSDVITQLILFGKLFNLNAIVIIDTLQLTSYSNIKELSIDLASTAADFLQQCVYTHVCDDAIKNKISLNSATLQYFKLLSLSKSMCALMHWNVHEVADFGKTRLRKANHDHSHTLDMKVLNR